MNKEHQNHPLANFHYCPQCGCSDFSIADERSRCCPECGFHFYANASAAVAAFIVNAQKELLLCTRAQNPGKGGLDLPGGFVDLDETLEEGLARELREELGVEMKTAHYCFSLPNIYSFGGMAVHTIDSFFEVTIDESAELHCQDDVSDAKYYKLQTIDLQAIALKSIRKGVGQYIKKQTEAKSI